MSSILDDIKHMLGLLPENTAFDSDIIIHINSAFSTLTQLGVGPNNGFMITDDQAQWEDFFSNNQINNVKSYIFLRVKLLLDPPQVGFVIASMDRQIQEHEWRMMVAVDSQFVPDESIIDGGSP